MSKHPFRVLSLNGGGARALFQAHFLNCVSKLPEIGRFWEDFDLIIGTSAGAIVAGALWIKEPPEVIADLFENVSKDAFPQALWNGLRITLRLAATGTSFSNSSLKKLLTQVYGADTTLGDFAKPILAITATEIENSRIRVFSPITQSADRQLKLVDVVMASAALPGVFSDYPVFDPESNRPRHYIDGCLWGNAPLLAATALSLKNGKTSLSDLRVVSIGTAGQPYSMTSHQYRQITVNSAPFFHCLFDMASSTAERVSFAVVDCLLDPSRVLHVDGALDKIIKAWEIEAARRELPRLAESCARSPDIVSKLRSIIA
ncbi:MAG: patatin-like phospholipase family protein [Methylococcaceae bacterium]|nr:patatin-like phospholipase family protein [Methylococcaceae bacterium]MCI0668679.1 patatin-like phospholipase family protein [Methylococcaceae bacterium]MCI0733442.1 patatin-like phospholipase family protein [Methylococcaceae bacterium]